MANDSKIIWNLFSLSTHQPFLWMSHTTFILCASTSEMNKRKLFLSIVFLSSIYNQFYLYFIQFNVSYTLYESLQLLHAIHIHTHNVHLTKAKKRRVKEWVYVVVRETNEDNLQNDTNNVKWKELQCFDNVNLYIQHLLLLRREEISIWLSILLEALLSHVLPFCLCLTLFTSLVVLCL